MMARARVCSLLSGLVLGLVSFGVGANGLGGIALAKTIDAPSLDSSSGLAKSHAATYTRAMEVGYAAAKKKDYHTALINFRRALRARPGDRYARAAIGNMQTYIAQERAEAARQAELVRLQDTLALAVTSSDWACAAASVDRLVQLVPPNSPERARLVAYRGELSGFIEGRANVDQWSTVCPGGRV
ncbi:MAG: hypothetical protein ACFCVD_11185 [Nodosilinea sp.]